MNLLLSLAISSLLFLGCTPSPKKVAINPLDFDRVDICYDIINQKEQKGALRCLGEWKGNIPMPTPFLEYLSDLVVTLDGERVRLRRNIELNKHKTGK